MNHFLDTLTDDPLGLRPVFRCGNRQAPSIAALIAADPACAGLPGPLAMAEMLVFHAPVGERTTVGAITRDLAPRPFVAPPPDPARSVDTAVDGMIERLRASLAAKLAGHAGLVPVAATGGFDSRLIMAVLDGMGRTPQPHVLAGSGHAELAAARAVTRRLGVPLHVVRPPADIIATWFEIWLRHTDGQADPHMLLVAPLLTADLPDGAPLLHGGFGGYLSGDGLERYPADALASHDALAHAIVERYAYAAVKRVWQAALPSVSADDLAHSVRQTLRTDVLPYQAAVLWHVEHRERKAICSHLPMLGERYRVISPYCDHDYAAWMLSMPLALLDRRQALRQAFARRFPRLAEVPHPNESQPIVPRLSEMLGRFVRDRLQFGRTRDVQRLTFGGLSDAQRRAWAKPPRVGLPWPENLLDLCFPGGEIRYDGLQALRRMWAMGASLDRLLP